jgi:hypothetical protein
MQLIDADDENTWPKALLRGLEADREAIATFQRERARIDRAAEEDVMLRVCRPANPNQNAWDAALALGEHATASGHLLGFHATRLVEHEIEEIRQQGLQLLSVELLCRRVEALTTAGAITDQQARRLLGYNQAAEDNRSGRTAFFFTRAQLKDHAGLDHLCRSWGGEALYNYHEDDPETGPLLRSIGIPSIVAAAVRVADIEPHFDIGQRLVNIWCVQRGIVTELPLDFGGVVRTHTPAASILRIIGISDPEFLALTAHDRWRNPLT